MKIDRNPVNSNPFQLIEELKTVDPNSPLVQLGHIFRISPLEDFDGKQTRSHPRLPNRDWTNKELEEINRWLHEIRGIAEGCLPALAELLTYPNPREETYNEYRAILNLSSYLELLSIEVAEQRGIVLSQEARLNAVLLEVVSDARERAWVKAQLDRPGEA